VARTPENEFTYSKRERRWATCSSTTLSRCAGSPTLYGCNASTADPVAGVAMTANDHLSTSQQGPAASGMHVAVAVGPLGWHGDRRNSPCLAGLDTLFWVDRLDGGGVVFRVVPRT
jgi:hypothetical protein